MRVHRSYWLWAQGTIAASVTIQLSPSRRYLVTGGLVGTSGTGLARLYLAVVCKQQSIDHVSCGIRRDSGPPAELCRFTANFQRATSSRGKSFLCWQQD